MEEDDDRVRIRIEYVILSGPESDHNYPMLRSHGKQRFLLFARAPGWRRLAVNVYVRGEHRRRYWWKVESVNGFLERDLDVSILDLYYPQEGLSFGSGSDVTNQYPAKVEEYKRTNAAALDGLLHHQVVVVLTIEAPKLTIFLGKRTIIRLPVCQFQTTRVSSCSFQSVLADQSSAS